MKKVFTTILLLFIATPILAYYNPGAPDGFVTDFGNVISDEMESEMENKLIAFEQETSNEIAVVTIESLSSIDGEDDYIENFAEKLFAEWGIGKSAQGGPASGGKDNGVLVLVAIEDREMRIEVGYGLEGALTDAQSNWIINNQMKPAFQAENYGEGINLAVDSVISATKGEYVAEEKIVESSNGWSWDFIFWMVIVGFLWLSSILGRSKSWWAGGIIGGVAGIVLGFIWGWLWIGVGSIIGLAIFGLILDFFVSKSYSNAKSAGKNYPWWIGGGRGGSGGGGFGGFGGGMSGGGGSSGSW